MIKVSSASSKRQRRLCGTTLVPVCKNGHSLAPYGRKSAEPTERKVLRWGGSSGVIQFCSVAVSHRPTAL